MIQKPTLNVEHMVNNHRAYLIPMGDIHIGSEDFAQGKLARYVDWVRNTEHAYIVLVGDIFEVQLPGSRVTDAFGEPLMPLDDALDLAEEVFNPVSDRILGAIDGNHDFRASKMLGTSPVRQLLTRFGIQHRYATDEINLALQVQNITYDIKTLHGWGGARRVGAHLNKLEEMSNITGDCDVYLAGHEHTLFVSRYDRELTSSVKGRYLKQYLVGTGCFCYYTSFQRQKALRRPHVGAARIRFNGEKRDVHTSI